MNKGELFREAEAYLEASQRLKAAKQVLQEKRAKLIPAITRHVKPDENENRTLEFGNAKLALVPQRKVDENALKAILGPETTRFVEHGLGVSLHLIRLYHGTQAAEQVEDAVRAAIRKVLKVERLPARVVQTVTHFDSEAALASLPKDERKDVKEIVTYTLRPYPEKKGFSDKVKAAFAWLWPTK